ncbi:MAG: HD domain-containing protein [Bacteroidota bacterium]
MKTTLQTKAGVIADVRRLQYFYALKREIRYKFSRTTSDFSESVAEHVFGMHVVATHFLPLENPKRTWDRCKIFELITWHDIDEIETGDTISWKRTAADHKAEAEALTQVLLNLPEAIRTHTEQLLSEYQAQKTPEATFVKAIDKLEPLVHLYNDEGRELCQSLGLTLENSEKIKVPYMIDFPVIRHYKDILHECMDDEGFFISGEH